MTYTHKNGSARVTRHARESSLLSDEKFADEREAQKGVAEERLTGERVADERDSGQNLTDLSATGLSATGQNVADEEGFGKSVTDEEGFGKSVTDQTVSAKLPEGQCVTDDSVTDEGVPDGKGSSQTGSGRSVTDAGVEGPPLSVCRVRGSGRGRTRSRADRRPVVNAEVGTPEGLERCEAGAMQRGRRRRGTGGADVTVPRLVHRSLRDDLHRLADVIGGLADAVQASAVPPAASVVTDPTRTAGSTAQGPAGA